MSTDYFEELPVFRKERSRPSFSEPRQIGYFSLDGQRNYMKDSSQIKYFCPPKRPDQIRFDLNVSYDRVIRKEPKEEGIDSLLRWILDHKSSESTQKPLNADFVCYRGLLTKILCTPYENQEDWAIIASKHRGTIYMCLSKTERDQERLANQTEKDLLMSSWGYKFEQYLMTDDPEKPPRPLEPANENAEYNCVVRTRLNDHSLLYGAEVDGLEPGLSKEEPQETGKTSCYVELKTSRQITAERQHRNFCRFKLIKWWAQSYLVGIRKIYCGFRDDRGVVNSMELFRTEEIPFKCQEHWKPAICLNFCQDFLSYVKGTNFEEDDPRCILRFYWSPGKTVTCTKLKKDSKTSFLREWFIEGF